MKRCSTCQRTFTDDNLTFCLDDGSPLLGVESNWASVAPTAAIPGARATNPPVYGPGSNPGIQFNNKTIAIVGASLLTVGIFMPVVSFLGLISVSYFQLLQFSASFFTGIVLALIGVGGFILAFKRSYKPLIGLGILALAILVFDFFRIKTAIAGGLPLNLPGARPGIEGAALGHALQNVIQISWGIFVMFAGAILLIVAGLKKEKA